MQTFLTTVTQKGQVTLPISFRRKLNLKTHSTVKISHDKQTIKINKVVDIFDLGGTIKAKKGMDALKAREYMEEHYERI